VHKHLVTRKVETTQPGCNMLHKRYTRTWRALLSQDLRDALINTLNKQPGDCSRSVIVLMLRNLNGY
jgi:hypothetical protein